MVAGLPSPPASREPGTLIGYAGFEAAATETEPLVVTAPLLDPIEAARNGNLASPTAILLDATRRHDVKFVWSAHS